MILNAALYFLLTYIDQIIILVANLIYLHLNFIRFLHLTNWFMNLNFVPQRIWLGTPSSVQFRIEAFLIKNFRLITTLIKSSVLQNFATMVAILNTHFDFSMYSNSSFCLLCMLRVPIVNPQPWIWEQRLIGPNAWNDQ